MILRFKKYRLFIRLTSIGLYSLCKNNETYLCDTVFYWSIYSVFAWYYFKKAYFFIWWDKYIYTLKR